MGHPAMKYILIFALFFLCIFINNTTAQATNSQTACFEYLSNNLNPILPVSESTKKHTLAFSDIDTSCDLNAMTLNGYNNIRHRRLLNLRIPDVIVLQLSFFGTQYTLEQNKFFRLEKPLGYIQSQGCDYYVIALRRLLL